MKHSLVLLTVLTCLAFSNVLAQQQTPANKPIEATYLVAQIQNISVDAENGDVYFDAADEHYVWHLTEGTKAEKLQAAFLIADRLKSSTKIETRRWEPREGQRASTRYRGKVLHHLLDGLVLHIL